MKSLSVYSQKQYRIGVHSMLDKLLTERKQQFLKESLKYLRLMFNDHFTLLLLFLLGAGGFLYRELLVLVTPEMLTLKILLSGILVFLINLTTIPSYMEEADLLFLMPKIHQVKSSYNRFAGQLLLLKSIIVIILLLTLSPLLNALAGYNTMDVVLFIAQVIIWQAVFIFAEKIQTLYVTRHNDRTLRCSLSICSMVLLCVSLIYSSLIGLVLTIVSALISLIFIISKKSSNQISIEQLIEKESKRKSTLYKLFSLVTDVPHLKQRSFRSKWISAFIKVMFPHHSRRIDYLLPRLFFRQNIFVKLYIRLIILGSLFIGMSSHRYLIWSFAVGFHFIILFQILPLMDNMKRRQQVLLNPFTKRQCIKGLERLLIRLSIIIILIFSAVALLNGWQTAVGLMLLNSVLTVLFVKIYVPYKLK